MPQRPSKLGYFVLEGVNSFATTYYFYYFYFFMEKSFGFGNRANLLLAALNGAVYALAAWGSGKFAQRFGYFSALKLGYATMVLAIASGLVVDSAWAHAAGLSLTMIGVCFVWPSLEALVSEGETPAGLQRMIGIYNVVWAVTGALAYFSGGALMEKLGARSLFYVPTFLELFQLGLTLWLARQARHQPAGALPAEGISPTPTAPKPQLSPRRAQSFLRMAWLANPSAYIAINTLVAVIPGIAGRLGLSTMAAGFVCSVWCFARLGAFVVLWHWNGWHYRFRWLLTSYLALIISFATILLVPHVGILILAQLILGLALGLNYYSSLFYSMDLSDTKGEHGGLHEAAIGLGNFAGPALGAASLYLLPQYANSSTWAVSGLLLLGLGGLTALWHNGRQ